MTNVGRVLLLTMPILLGGTAGVGAGHPALGTSVPGSWQDREDRFKRDQERLVGPWIYDDLDAGFAEARKFGKPVLLVFR